MRDIINIHVGQAGVQVGNCFWELMCIEHAIDEYGLSFDQTSSECEFENLDTFFHFTNANKMVPKCIMVDLEPTVIDEIRTGPYRSLFHKDRLLSGPEDASNNFARGFFTIGKLVLDSISRQIRRLFESCGSLNGFMISRSLGGGTGAGLTSTIFDFLSEFPKVPKVEISIYPSATMFSSTVEPYNALMAQHFCIEDIDLGVLFENESMYDICGRFLCSNNPSFTSINQLICQVLSSITASMRFPNILNCDLTVLTTNLIPYPRIHYPLCNFAPLVGYCNYEAEDSNINSITRSVFDRDNQMIKIDTANGRYMSCALFYRGEISPREVYSALINVKASNKLSFVDWCPTGFKVGICNSHPSIHTTSVLGRTNKNVAMLTNSSALGQAWQRLCHKFYLLYSKRSFIHWFVGEGMDECEFTEALYNISTLVKDYEEVVIHTKEPNKTETPGGATITDDATREE